MRICFLLLFAFIALPFSSHAAKLSLVGVVNNSEPKAANYNNIKAVPTYGGGALLEFRLIPMVGLELGALYASRKYELNTTTPIAGKMTLENKMYEFPALLRFHLANFLSFGIGGYYATMNGDVKITAEAGGLTSTSTASYASLGQTNSDYGLVTSVAMAFRLMPFTRLLLDGRYTMGLKNNSTAPSTPEVKYNDIQLLAGLQFAF